MIETRKSLLMSKIMLNMCVTRGLDLLMIKIMLNMYETRKLGMLMSTQMNNYIVMSYRDVIVITKFATRKASKAQSIVMY